MNLNDTLAADISVGPFPLDILMQQTTGIFLKNGFTFVMAPSDNNLWMLYAYGGKNSGTLSDIKTRKCETIDVNSETLISRGFKFEKKVFSLSLAAQIKWIGLIIGAGLVVYPYLVPTIDNEDYFSIPDAVTVQTMYATAMKTVSDILMTGVGLKAQVSVATTIEEVDLVVDTRLPSLEAN